MTAPKGKGHIFTTKQSKEAEHHHRTLVEQMIKKYPQLSIRKEVSIEELTNGKNPYSLMKNSKSQVWEADGGWICFGDKVVGVAECKYQDNRPNACERAYRYLAYFHKEPHRIFVSTYGQGFIKMEGGGATGPFIDMARHCGMVILENPTDEDFANELETWFENLLKGEL